MIDGRPEARDNQHTAPGASNRALLLGSDHTELGEVAFAEITSTLAIGSLVAGSPRATHMSTPTRTPSSLPLAGRPPCWPSPMDTAALMPRTLPSPR